MYNENYQPLAFYEDHSKQYFRKFRAFGQILPVYAPDGRIIPFQLPVPANVTSIQKVEAFSMDNQQAADITQELSANGNLFISPASGKHYAMILNKGANYITVPNGNYYLIIYVATETGTKIYYSEAINICDNVGLTRIIFWQDENIMPLPEYNFEGFIEHGFKFWVWVKSEFGKPIYIYEDKIKRRQGYPFPEEIISIKRYQLEIFESEPFLDGFRLARLFTYLAVVSGNETIKVYNMEMSVEWDDTGYVGIATLVIDTGNIIRSIGAGRTQAKDFNNDFNDDYL